MPHENDFLTKSPPNSPPKLSKKTLNTCQKTAAEEKTAVLARAHLQLSRISEKYSIMFEEVRNATTFSSSSLTYRTRSGLQVHSTRWAVVLCPSGR